jgi:hypothetical protein
LPLSPGATAILVRSPDEIHISNASAAQQTPDRLVVTRATNNVNNPAALPFSRIIADQSIVEALYADVAALPPFPTGPLPCPNDFGIDYHLDFYAGSETVLAAEYRPSGCASLRLRDGTLKGDPTRSFGAHLRQALNLSDHAFLGFE